MGKLRLILAASLVTLVAACASGTGATPAPSAGSMGSSLGWYDELTGEPDKLDVATTVAPISSLARNIGGDRIRLHGIVPDATNSHTFEPSPSDARHLQAADLIVVNGLHLEQPTLDLAEASKKPGTPIMMLGDNTITPDEWLFDFSFPESEGDPNPHLWMNVPYALSYAELMRDWFSEADPDNAAYYDANFERLKARLDELDTLIRAGVATVPAENRKLLTYHDSWAYWAREYGFDVVGAVQASDFSDPSPREVAELIDQIRAEEVPAVFGSEVFPSPVLEQIARESGADFVDELRDDEPPGAERSAEHTYLGMLQKDMQIMIGALGGDPTIFDSFVVTDTWE
ncbi:MAG TPA: metal ABC transporter substrate-binding protein [Candidatus Limnocylindrales bacterium]|nr:metal ABC transporter substrate-binding protein [Candidatus Limnocylindrales bacterium]